MSKFIFNLLVGLGIVSVFCYLIDYSLITYDYFFELPGLHGGGVALAAIFYGLPVAVVFMFGLNAIGSNFRKYIKGFKT